MPRATCRCGQSLSLPADGSDRVVCPKCGAKVRIRVRRDEETTDGYIRFFCPCGRRLKVAAEGAPTHGKCPDCGRVVPVPARSTSEKPPGHPEADTVDLGPEQLAALQRWAQGHGVSPADAVGERPEVPTSAAVHRAAETTARAEAGLRVCPNCRKPVHLGADVCRTCGTPMPRR